MAKKFLDDQGLLYFWQKIKTLLGRKVEKVDGKGLSTNDYTNEEKTKLSSISSNAQVNTIESIQVNSNEIKPTTAKVVNIDLSDYALKKDVASVYKLKGSITWANLIALTDAEIGDVYNVNDKGGGNYVCIVAKTAGESSWDKLGETIDLSDYYTETESENKFYHTITETTIGAESFTDTNVTKTTTTIRKGSKAPYSDHSIVTYHYGNATTSKAGLMSAEDKGKVGKIPTKYVESLAEGTPYDDIIDGATVSVEPLEITTMNNGSKVNTAWSHYLYKVATTSYHGLMSKDDKTKIDKLEEMQALTNAEIDTIFAS